MMIKYRVHEVAKDFNLTSREISDILKKHLDISKKAQTALDSNELDIIFETLTQASSVESFDEYFAMQKTKEKHDTEKPADKKEAKGQSEKKTKESSTKDKKSKQTDVKGKEPAKPSATPFKKNKEKQKKEADPNAAVQSRTKGERLVINTRASNVELDKYNEKYEKIASANRPANENIATKQKFKQKSQQYRRQGMRSRRRESEADRLKRIAEERAKKTLVITVPEEITVGSLAMLLKMTASEVIKKLFSLGVMATVNEVIDFETAEIVATELGAKVNKEVVVTIEERIIDDSVDEEDNLQLRSPVVVVMGHVDHGKTSLLDAIRNTSVTDTEAGGITQHIGAYSVGVGGQDITFLDTPGHAAFTSMRARGAMATDIAILVVAADDGIMPQTVEAINHAKAAEISIVIAINKMDKPTANPDRIMQQLTEYGLVTEEWGGDTICVPVSAKTGDGIDKLLESVLLIAEMAELKANPNRAAKGIVIEAKLDKGRGAVATLLVQNGTLNSGDIIVAGMAVGRVRVMTNDLGQKVEKAGPSTPVEITGLAEVPSAGDAFDAVTDERLARELVEQRRQQQKEEQFSAYQKVTLDNLFSSISSGELKDLNIIVKADVQGSAEAVKQNLEKLTNEEVRVNVIHVGVGAINESDVMLANASNAIVVGFNVRPDPIATANAERDGVDLRMYRVIYDCIEEIESAIKGMLEPKYRDVNIGRIEVRNVFKLSSSGVISGSYVLDGKVARNAKIRLIRDGIVITEDEIDSLRRFKDDVREVQSGYECGIGLKHYNDIKEGDIFEAFITEEYRED
ncbi:MAG TPA: translation initiation factor IF-2 [Oscillospiraceae bacterium]|nr:translation initiation factor IF-2 [Oscillospiraceae bacterium]